MEIKLDSDLEIRLKPHLKAKGDLDKHVNAALRAYLPTLEEDAEASLSKRFQEGAMRLAGMKE